MYRPRMTTGLLSFLGLLLVLSVPVTWGQHYRPDNPVMDYVPQNTGIYDKLYCQFTEPDCRTCHGASTAALHHDTEQALLGNCSLDLGGYHDPGYLLMNL